MNRYGTLSGYRACPATDVARLPASFHFASTAIRRQAQLIGPGQRVILGKRVGKRRNGVLKPMEDRPLNRPPH